MRRLLLATALVALGACSGSTGDTTSTSTSTGGGTGASSTNGSGAGSTSSTSGAGSTSSTSSAGNTGGNGSGSTSGAGLCGQATLFAGNAQWGQSGADPSADDHSPADLPADGDVALGGFTTAPYHFGELLFSNGSIITHAQLSVWSVDGSGKLHHILGDTLGEPARVTGPCASAQPAIVWGSALLADGSLLLADSYVNTIFKVSHPLDPSTCTVSYYAGPDTDITASDLADLDDAADYGHVDGAAHDARFDTPRGLTVDSAGNVYVLDGADQTGHATIRKIAASDQSVTTLASVDTGASPMAYGSIVAMGGKVYVWDRENSGAANVGRLSVLDPAAATPALTTLFTGHGSAFGGDDSSSFKIGSISTDGSKLYVWANSQLFTFDAAGHLSGPIAGVPNLALDFDDGYDPQAAQTGATVQLFSNAANTYLGDVAWTAVGPNHEVYFTGHSEDYYVEKLSGCP